MKRFNELETQIINMTDSIMEIYDKLYKNELENRADTSEHIALEECLKSSLELEQSLYDKLDFFASQTMLNKFVKDIGHCFEVEIDFGIIKKENNREELKQRRIVNKLFKRCFLNSLDDYPLQYLKKLEPEQNILNYMVSIQNDYLNTLLYFLDSFVPNQNNPDEMAIKQYFQKIKYYISFLFENIEADFLKKNFKVNSILYWCSPLYKTYYGYSEEESQKMTESFISCTFNKIYAEILSENTQSLKDQANAQKFFLNCLLFRVSQQFILDTTKAKVVDEVQKLIFMKNLVGDDNLTSETMLSIIKDSSNDRGHINLVRFL